MDTIIAYIKNRNVHTPYIALARFLLALGMLLTLTCNDMNVVANHSYERLPDYKARHTTATSVPLKQADMFLQLPPAAAKGIAIIVLLLVMTGLVPQVTGILHFIVCFGYHNYFVIINGGDEVTFVLSLLLLPICLTDPRLNQWRTATHTTPARNVIANIALLVVQVQAAYIYLSAGLEKLPTKVWREGTAVYYYTSHYRLGARPWLRHINEWLTLTPVVKVLSWSVILLEILLAAAILMPVRYRRRLFIPALVFHFLIVINFGLISFFFAMAGLLVLLLLAGPAVGKNAAGNDT